MSRKASKVGNCFQVAANLVIDAPSGKLVLAHGICTGRGSIAGEHIGHAWVEDGDTVLDYSNGNMFVGPRDFYYAMSTCRSVHLYNQKQTEKLLLKYRHFGPWPEDEEINQSVCRKDLHSSRPSNRVRRVKRTNKAL